MSDDWVDDLESLPALPAVVTRLQKVMADELCSADDITNVISSDVSLASNILKIVNSPAFGAARKVSEISRAVVMLGFSEIRTLAIGLGVTKTMKNISNNVDLDSFWNHSLITAAGAKVLALRTGFPRPEEAFVAGLLHDIGELVMAVRKPQQYAEVVALGPQNRLEHEHKMLGIAHPRAGRKLLKYWNIPSHICDVVRKHHEEKAFASADDHLLALVALADILARVSGMSCEESVSERAVIRLLKNLEIDISQTKEILAANFWAVSEARIFLDVYTDNPWMLDSGENSRAFRVVIISTQSQRVAWVAQVLEYLGHEIIPMSAFFSSIITPDLADLILIDGQSISGGQMTKMKPLLASYLQRIVIYGTPGAEAVRQIFGDNIPMLGAAFNQADLETLFK